MSIHSRSDLPLARRVVIKAGTSVVSTPDGYPSLSRMANIVEHVSMMHLKDPQRPLHYMSVIFR
jgi:glutamate 5-kinase